MNLQLEYERALLGGKISIAKATERIVDYPCLFFIGYNCATGWSRAWPLIAINVFGGIGLVSWFLAWRWNRRLSRLNRMVEVEDVAEQVLN